MLSICSAPAGCGREALVTSNPVEMPPLQALDLFIRAAMSEGMHHDLHNY